MEAEKRGAASVRKSRRQILAQVAVENIRLIERGTFMPDGLAKRTQNRMIRQCKEVDIIRLPDLQALRENFWQRHPRTDGAGCPVCRVTNEDCCSAAKRLADRSKPLMMNFADPYTPGGGYLTGTSAQEESICRRTTLYASLRHPEAYEVYQLNRMLRRPADTCCMIWSPVVYIFRDTMLRLSEDVTEIAVLSLSAPNLNGPAAQISQEEIDRIMLRRIENFLMKAVEEGYQTLVLGAWGCGAFGHNPVRVAACFQKALYEEGFAGFFQEIAFAVLDHSSDQRCYQAFQRQFAPMAAVDCRSPAAIEKA